MTNSISRLVRRFATRTDGNVSMMFGLSMTFLMTVIGAGIDYGRVQHQKSKADGIADTAVLAAVAAAIEADKAKKENVIDIAEQAGLDAWAANAKAAKFDVEGAPDVEVTTSGQHDWKATVTFEENYSTTLMSMFGEDMFPIHTFAEAQSGFAEVQEHWDIHMAVDVSASMGIGATQSDINVMTADPQMMRCSFACHYSTAPGLSDTMAVARSKGYKIRIDVVKDAINQVSTKLETIASSNNIAMALHGFTTSLGTLVAKTTTLSSIRNYAINLGLTPGSVGNTNYRVVMEQVTTALGSNGDGTSSSSPKKMVIIVTDGVHDSTTWEPNIYSQPMPHYYTGTMAPSFCDTMKNAGIKVGVLYVPYIIPPGYGGYVNGFYSTIPTKLQACASPDMYFEATQSTQIEGMLTTLINTAFGSESDLRLTQ